MYVFLYWHTFVSGVNCSQILIWEEVQSVDTFDKFLELQKELLQSQLKIIYRQQQLIPYDEKKIKRTSNLDIVADILESSDKPLHISKIIESAENNYQVQLERDSTVSALVKKITSGKRFIRVAPNTFALKTDKQ